MTPARKQMILTCASMVAVATLATGGIALASDGHHQTDMIHACVNRDTGKVRIARHCTRRERALTWNKQGPAGPAGLPGPRGSAGQAARPGRRARLAWPG